MSPYRWLLPLPIICTCVLCSDLCGDMKQVVGMESGDVLLEVDKKGVMEISWVIKNSLIALTKPDESVQIKTNRYHGRLYNGTNGSLNITRLNKDDQGVFVANVRYDEQECNQNYSLTVYSKLTDDDIRIRHNITGGGTCHMTLACTVAQLDASVAWSDSAGGLAQETPTVEVTEPHANASWTCTASHAAARVSRSVVPLALCREERRWKIAMVAVAVGLSLLAAAAVIGCVWRSRDNVCSRMKWIRKENDDPQQADNIYWEIDQSKEVCGKMKNTAKTGVPKLESVYMTAIHPSVKSAQNRRDLLQIDDDSEVYDD